MAFLRALPKIILGCFGVCWLSSALVHGCSCITWCTRSKESECKTNLKAWFTAEKLSHGERLEYLTDFSAIGFWPELNNRYLYTDDPLGVLVKPEDRHARQQPHQGLRPAIGRGTVKPADVPARVAGGAQVGVVGICPHCEATAVCVAQLDDDEEVDVWSISTANRVDEETGEAIGAGVPFHDRSDRHPVEGSRLAGWFR